MLAFKERFKVASSAVNNLSRRHDSHLYKGVYTQHFSPCQLNFAEADISTDLLSVIFIVAYIQVPISREQISPVLQVHDVCLVTADLIDFFDVLPNYFSRVGKYFMSVFIHII